jgi:D-glycero-D-manno-heptose 1,7-bisphosphate phosphatase
MPTMKLVILDRDGVINHDSDQFIKSPDEWKPIPGSLEAIARLNQYGWRVVVASNQSGIGRGLFGMDTLNAIHDKMIKSLAQVGGRLEAIFFCPHPADSTCECRKPRPGMYREIAERFNVDLATVPVIGDSLRDLEAAVAVGAQPYLVRTGKGERTEAEQPLPEGTQVFADLAAVVAHLTLDR